MNKKLKAKWLRALRSGSYRQTKSRLTNSRGTGFCCLGVLADIQGCEWAPDILNGGMIPITPRGRKPWVFMTDDHLPKSRAGGLSRDDQGKLMDMNDGGVSFKKIADWIEANL